MERNLAEPIALSLSGPWSVLLRWVGRAPSRTTRRSTVGTSDAERAPRTLRATIVVLALALGWSAGTAGAVPSVVTIDLNTVPCTVAANPGAPCSTAGFARDTSVRANAGGHIVGSITVDSNGRQHAFTWSSQAGMLDLGTLPGGTFSAVSPQQQVNADGVVVGFSGTGVIVTEQCGVGCSSTFEESHAFRWTHTDGMRDLDPSGQFGPRSTGRAVSDSGLVVGEWNSTSDSGRNIRRAFVWRDGVGGMVSIGNLADLSGTPSEDLGVSVRMSVRAVNAAGQAVGDGATAGGDTHAWSWTQSGGLIDLGTLGGTFSSARAVASDGAVYGNSTTLSTTLSGERHAFRWTQADGMVDLTAVAQPLTLGGTDSSIRAVNDAGQVVGSATDATGAFRAFSWTSSGGAVALTPPGDLSSQAVDVNESGQVVGSRSLPPNFEGRAFLWTEADGMIDLGPGGARGISDNGQISSNTNVVWEVVEIDASLNPSAGSFSDTSITLPTTGSVVDTGGLPVAITDAPIPAEGVLVTVGSGAPGARAMLSTCGGLGTVWIPADSTVVITCGSVTVRVITGSAQVTLAGGLTTLTIPEGGAVKVSEQGDGVSVENLGNVGIGLSPFAATILPGGTVFVSGADTHTRISSDSPDPSIEGQGYTVTGTVNVDPPAQGPAGADMPGRVVVTTSGPSGAIPGAGCIDASLTLADTPDTYAFSCVATSAVTGTFNLAARYEGGGGNYRGSLSPQVDHTVSQSNSAPNPGAISGASPVGEGSQHVYSSNAGDPDGDTLLYTWSVSSGNATIHASSGSGVTLDFGDGPSTVVLHLVVDDQHGHTASPADMTVTVSNVAPAATLSNSGPVSEGSAATISFSNQSDPSAADTAAGFHYAFSCTNGDLSGATYGSSGTGSFTSCTYPDGPSTHVVKARIIDRDGGSTETTTTVVVNNVAPIVTIGSLTGAGAAACIGGNTVTLGFSWTDPAGSNDTYSYVVNWGDGSSTPTTGTTVGTSPVGGLTHGYAAGGPYLISVTVNDEDGGASPAATTAPFSFLYNMSGILQPINATGTRSSFKLGSTIPVKLKVTDCSAAPVGTLTLKVNLERIDLTADPVNEVVSTSASDTGSTMRFTGAPNNQYIFNLSTKRSQFNANQDLVAGTYHLWITGTGIAQVDAYLDVKQ